MTERTPGVWRLQATSEPDVVTGRTRRLSRTVRGSTADARRALQRLVTEAGAGLQGGADLTVATLLGQFLTTATLAPTTRQDWTSLIDRHLIPGVGHIALSRLSARDCDLLYHQMALEGLGPSRVRNAHVVLHRACAQAVRWRWITRNPVADATRPARAEVDGEASDRDRGTDLVGSSPGDGSGVRLLARRCRCNGGTPG